MHVTVKVKHLVLGGLVLGLAAFFYLHIAAPRLELYWAEKHYTAGRPGGSAELLEAIGKATGERRMELIRTHIISPGIPSPSTGYEVYIGANSVSSHEASEGNISPALAPSEALPFLLEYIREGAADRQIANAAATAAFYYRMLGRSEEALSVLKLGEDRLGGRSGGTELKLARTELLLELGWTPEAKLLLDELAAELSPQDIEGNGKAARLRAFMLIQEDRMHDALDTVTQGITAVEAEWQEVKDPLTESGIPAVLEELRSVKGSLERSVDMGAETVSSVSGTLKKSDGTPLAGAGVFLRNQGSVNHSVTSGEPYQTITDELGHYQFIGVAPDSYQLFIGLNLSQIDGWTWPIPKDPWIDVDNGQALTENITLTPLMNLIAPVNDTAITGNTVRFEWEPVPGAAYYSLSGNLQVKSGWVGSGIAEHVTDHSVELPVAELYDKDSGISYETVDGKAVPDPITLLGYANSEARFSWSVQAYDAAGNPLTRSNGYRLHAEDIKSLPFFRLQERQLSEGDRLLLAGQMKEASAAYQDALTKQPEDLHSLRMLIRIGSAETIRPAGRDDASNGADTGVQSADKRERLARLIRMTELNPSEAYLFELNDYYYQARDWTAYEDSYAQMEAASRQPLSVYIRSVHAYAQLKQLKAEKAIREFEALMTGDPDHRFIGSYLAAVLYTGGDTGNALALARQYPERYFAYNGRNWTVLVQDLIREEASGEPDYRNELKEALGWSFSGDKNKLEEWMAATSLTAMKAFIHAVEAVN